MWQELYGGALHTYFVVLLITPQSKDSYPLLKLGLREAKSSLSQVCTIIQQKR